MNIKNYFKDWAIGYYRANHSDGRELWICNGFSAFKDCGNKAFLMGFNIFDKYIFWKELRAEIRRRNLK